MGTTTHPIVAYGERLLPRNLDLVDEQLNALLNRGKEFLDARSQGIDAARKVSDDYKPAAKARRHHELIHADKESPQKLGQAYQNIKATTQRMRDKIQKDARPKGPDSDIRALLEFNQKVFLLGQLQNLSFEELERGLRQTAAAGDRSYIDALAMGLKPLLGKIQPQLMESAEQNYILATQGDAVQALELQEAVEDAAKECIHRINYQADRLVQDAERKGEILPKPPGMTSENPAKNLSDSQKAALVSQVGLETYKSILRGETELPAEFAPEPTDPVTPDPAAPYTPPMAWGQPIPPRTLAQEKAAGSAPAE